MTDEDRSARSAAYAAKAKEMTADEFDRDVAEAVRYATEEGPVTILDSKGKGRMTICVPRAEPDWERRALDAEAALRQLAETEGEEVDGASEADVRQARAGFALSQIRSFGVEEVALGLAAARNRERKRVFERLRKECGDGEVSRVFLATLAEVEKALRDEALALFRR